MTQFCAFLPPYIGSKLPEGHLTVDERVRGQRESLLAQGLEPAATGDQVSLYDAEHRTHEPGVPTTTADADAARVDKSLGVTLDLYGKHGTTFGSAGVAASVHYGSNYDNAFWSGRGMLFGDGDGRLFASFTVCPDVAGHELTHGRTGSKLAYQDQAGALNESMSDCWGAYVRQEILGLPAADPDGWLIGKGLLLESGARALRDMLHPGAAYNTAQLGKDPQPADMSGYVHTSDDEGGVHLNSGIPNRAFALTAIALGSTAGAIDVWDLALDNLNNPAATFVDFAQATVRAAGSSERAALVTQAWAAVQVLSAPTPQPTPQPQPTPAPQPTPTPAPAGGLDDALDSALRRFLSLRIAPAYLRKAAQAWLDARGAKSQ